MLLTLPKFVVKELVSSKVMPNLPNYVLPLYYNSFIKSCFSYFLMFWTSNERSSRYKLIYKIDKLITQ